MKRASLPLLRRREFITLLAGIPQMNPEPEADRSNFRSDPEGPPWLLAVALHFGAQM